jgi:hypothetical protein
LGTPIYSSFKPLERIEHPLLAKGIVLQQGARRYVLCAVDWCELCNATHTLFRRKLAEAVGTDPAYVAVQTVHQHTAPMADLDASNLLDVEKAVPPHPSARSIEEPAERIAAVAKESLAKLMPFDHIGTGEGKVERVASNRRVPLPDGKIGPRMSSCRDPKLIEMPEGQIDPMVKTVTFALGTMPLVRLHYYATHPQSFYGDPRASYDFAGIARERLQEKEQVLEIYFNGCGGDIAAGKYNDGTPPVRDELSARLYAGMEAAVASTRYERAGAIRWRTTQWPMTPREDGGYSEAENRTRMSDEKGAPATRYSAAGVLVFRGRANQPAELSALQIGRVHILHLPGEPMVEFQLYAQSLRPKDFVAVAGYGDCGMGYICTERSFSEGGYEPTASLTAPNSEATFRAAIRQLLERA